MSGSFLRASVGKYHVEAVYGFLFQEVPSCDLAWPPPLQSLQLIVEKCQWLHKMGEKDR